MVHGGSSAECELQQSSKYQCHRKMTMDDKQLIEFVCQQKEWHNMADRNETDHAQKLCKMR